MSILRCITCNEPMKLVKKMETKRMFKARRYHCDLCDYSETKFGDGYASQRETREAVREAKRDQKIQSKNPFVGSIHSNKLSLQ